MKRLSFLLVAILGITVLFANDFSGRTFAEKKGIRKYSNIQYVFSDSQLTVCNAEDNTYTQYPYEIRGGSILLGEPVSGRYDYFSGERKLNYFFEDGTSQLGLSGSRGIHVQLVDVTRNTARTDLKESIVDNCVADVGLLATTASVVSYSVPKKIETKNSGLAGKKHPETGVEYYEKTVLMPNGKRVKGTFADFKDSCVFETKIPRYSKVTGDMYKASDKTQFEYCNKQLSEGIKTDTNLRSRFNAEQIEQIECGLTPDGYTWHHTENPGTFQLVDSRIHAQSGHTGGRSLWGGGSAYR